jgi:hypothetical protein
VIANREVCDGGAKGSDMPDCLVTADESRGGFLVTAVVVLDGSQYEGEVQGSCRADFWDIKMRLD